MHSSANNVSELLKPTKIQPTKIKPTKTSQAGGRVTEQVAEPGDELGNDLVQPQIIDDFINMYQSLNKNSLYLLKQVYSKDVVFQDPLHKVHGLNDLTNYFANLYENVDSIDFDIKQVNATSSQASVFWCMTYSHSKLNGGNPITVDGMSHLSFSEKITAHRDYFDLGQMLYEQLPLLGKVISMVKTKASS
ncbi:nuclear transport factor 2 family protein [Shewanella olleyana]|uniref:nuclear transport factor 2 family protein n=1 Tax=Shewanella olleyana TaxID=135626 RepID=UPI00200E6317|nr:nuclear transport factor 2 family protein [Shewanella olleyana]MCL1067202.1 nuclear transport factor 2 family protein [Shewanella olleyana]